MVIETRSAQPPLPLWIFADRNRVSVYLILLCLASTFFGMFLFLTLFTQVTWGYSALRGGLAYLPFVGGFIVFAGICSKIVPRLGARVPMTIGAVLAPAGMFWLARVNQHSQYLTGVCLPLLVFAAAAGLIFVPLTMTLVAGISDEHSGVASSMFNASADTPPKIVCRPPLADLAPVGRATDYLAARCSTRAPGFEILVAESEMAEESGAGR